ncbi:hypothetical protein AGR3A_Lc180152 [Agrobacterium tomkonis CFBP 6623]|uniref:Uncharacterized protein n=1 Tax=Agrobacterium tomkonis CFBP 6623 TaxID=1183432 RepID=A0A1S7S2L4_9HYPH|nr:hypothetical protein AGR3A_Lc180152 [Agrobacterium tomkonis CFBP 6623]
MKIASVGKGFAPSAKFGTEQVPGRLRLLPERMLDELKAITEPRAPYSAMAGAWLEDFMQKIAWAATTNAR